ncbi:two-component system sensor histidine kinase PhoQ [Dickeya aquatica]|uniref:histidine kinase n=1 Tax=Dickeya aquatica TaxID=1401087 RepID=A0A375AB92_9GAMM|nr:two-component system sensor histidine kinase PhoQ [Dickeya aquatica]SLM63374.1 sensory histidine kinase in two-compoent regulatory system with PhoP [Dickeya aquatica]
MKKAPPLSLRFRFLIATAAVVLALTLSYGIVAVVGYSVSFDKTSFRLLRGESNLVYSLAQWRENQLTIATPPEIDINYPTLVFIYDKNGKLLWRERAVPELESQIKPEWLEKTDYHELDADSTISNAVCKAVPLKCLISCTPIVREDKTPFTHSIAVECVPESERLPQMVIVVVDRIPQELQQADIVWEWFRYVFIAHLVLVLPLLWLAAHCALSRISTQISELEQGSREHLNEYPPQELNSLVRNLNTLLSNERQRYHKYRTTLTDLTHSLKTPLAVLQTTLRSLRSGKELTIEQAEPIMLTQLAAFHSKLLLPASSQCNDHLSMIREVHSVPAQLDALCSALNKVYQRKGVVLTMDIAPELTFIGEKNDFMEVMGNILDNACKYCLEFVEISALYSGQKLHLIIEDDGPGIPDSKREVIFQRGQRADTLRPGQGIGLAVAAEIIEQYQGEIVIGSSQLKVEAIFGLQHLGQSEG